MPDDAGLFDVDSVRRVETAARAALGGGVLMERAGQAAWRALLQRWPAARRIVVACGPGGNGGDGWVLARHALEAGRDVTVLVVDDREPRDADAAVARSRYVAAGGAVGLFDGAWPRSDVTVDALLGIGLAGPVSGALVQVIDAINAAGRPVLSLDVPSGLREGDVGGRCVRADATVEFLLPKLFLHTGAALDASGSLQVASLDVDVHASGVAPVAHALRPDSLARRLPKRMRDSHKGSHGRVLCIGGEAGSGGAILMCAEAALRAGAGLLRVHTRSEHVTALLSRLPEAMASTGEAAVEWADVVAIGPGLGRGPWGEELLRRVLGSGVAAVIDADGLNLLADAPRALRADTVLTPHPGEAARLLGVGIAEIQRDRPAALGRLVERFGCVVALKGAGTLVGAPGRCPALIAAGGPALATGGTGDVLTGVIAALRAQGLDAFDAAATGALLHATAGDTAAREGERGLRATDLMPHLRRLANP